MYRAVTLMWQNTFSIHSLGVHKWPVFFFVNLQKVNLGSITSHCLENEPGTKTGLERAAEIEPKVNLAFTIL